MRAAAVGALAAFVVGIRTVTGGCTPAGTSAVPEAPTLHDPCKAATARRGSPERGGPQWRELTSPHFRLRTDVPPECAHSVLVEYEERYQALRELAFPFEPAPPGRVTLMLFARGEDMRSVIEKTSDIAGWFVESASPWQDGTLAVLAWHADDRALSIFTHELTHHFVRFYFGHVPIWVNEGLADFYETLKFVDGQAELGAPDMPRQFSPTRWEFEVRDAHDGRVRRFTIHARGLPSIAELDRMTRSEFYGSPELDLQAGIQLRRRHYKGAWAVVHFLETGPEKYRNAFDEYVRLAVAGRSHRTAWDSAFAGIPAAEIESAWRARLDQWNNPGLRTRYAPATRARVAERVMSDAEVHLAWVMARSNSDRPEDLRKDSSDVEEALRKEPDNPEAFFARARIHLEAERASEAEADVRRAMDLAPDELRYVEGLALILLRLSGETPAVRWPRLEPLLARLAQPSASATALDLVASVAAARGRPDEGLEASKRSIQRDPACWRCHATLAALLYQKEDVEAALGAQQLALNLAPENLPVPTLLSRLKQYEAAVASKRAAKDPASWKPPPLDARDGDDRTRL